MATSFRYFPDPYSGGLLGQADPSFDGNYYPEPEPDPMQERASAFADEMDAFLATLPEDWVKPTELVEEEPEPEKKPALELVKPDEEVEKAEEAPLVMPTDEVERTDTSRTLGLAGQRRESIESQETYNVELTTKDSAYLTMLQNRINQIDSPTSEQVNKIADEVAEFVYGKGAKANLNQQDVLHLIQQRGAERVRGLPQRQALVLPTGDLGKPTDKEPEAPTIGESFVKGSESLFASGWAALEAVQEAAGADASKSDMQRQFYSAVADALPKGIKLDEVKNVSDALAFAQQQTFEQAPNLIFSLSGGAVGGLIKGSVGASVGAFGSSYTLELGQIEQGNKALNPDQKAGFATFLAASPAAALDAWLPGKIGSQLTARLGKEAADHIALRTLLLPANAERLAVLRQVAASAGKGMAVEGSTEGAQQAIEEIGSAVETGTPIEPGLLWRMTEAAVTGALVGGPANVAGDVAETAANRNAPISELEGAQFARAPESVATEIFSPQQGPGQTNLTPRPSYFPEARPVVRPVEQRSAPATPVVPTKRPVDPAGNEQQFLIPNGKITSKFGPRKSFTTANGQKASSNHAGIDIGLAEGARVPAGADGVVVHAGPKGGYGNAIIIKFSDGTSVLYGHLSRIGVEVGDQVSQGETVGRVGHTGNATGPHLHLERRDAKGRAVNPLTGRMVRTDTVADEQGNETYEDDTGWDTADTAVDYDEDSSETQNEIDDTFEQATGQSLRAAPEAPTEATPRTKRSIADVAAEALGERDTRIADDLASSLDQAKETNTAKIALRDLMSSTTMAREAAPSLPAETQQQGPIDLPAPPAEATGQQTFDYTQPLPGEEPVFDADNQEEVVGFQQAGRFETFRPIGQPPSIPEAAVPSEPETPPAQPLVVPVEQPTEQAGTENFVAELPEETPATTLGQDGSSEVNPEVEAQVEAIEEKLFDLEVDGTKSQVRPYLKKLIKQGVLEQADVDAMDYMFKDRDMEVEDITSEIRASVDIWADRQRGRAQVAVDTAQAGTIEGTPYEQVGSVEGRGPGAREAGRAKDPTALVRARLSRSGSRKARPYARASSRADREVRGLVATHEPTADHIAWLKEAGYPAVTLNELKPTTANVRQFTAAINQSKQASPYGAAVYVYSPGEYLAMRLFLSEDGKSGFALKKDGDIVSVFSDGGGKVHSMLDLAVQEGGTKLDAFDTVLPSLYAVSGFKEVARDKWNETYAPEGWDKETFSEFNNGQPDVVYMEYDATYSPFADQTEKPKGKASLTEEERREKYRIFAATFRDDVVKALSEINVLGRNDLTIEFVSKIEANGISSDKAAGYYYDRLVQIAARPWRSTTPRITTRHELIHWAKDIGVFTPLDWAVLRKWASNDSALMAWAKEAYPDEVLNPNGSADAQTVIEWRIEEAVAEGFARWQGGSLENRLPLPTKKVPPAVQKILIKLRDFIAKVRRAFGMAGVSQSEIDEAARILNEFQTGVAIQKYDARRAAARARRLGRTPADMALSRALANGTIDAEAYDLAKLTMPKEQTAWHGTHHPNIEEFKLDFIGTGEGNQAFGWGLYFAQNKDIAEYYRTVLTGGDFTNAIRVNDKSIQRFINDINPHLGGRTIARDVFSRIHSYLKTVKTGERSKTWLSELRGSFEYELLWAQRDAENSGQLVQAQHVMDQLEDGLAIFDLLDDYSPAITMKIGGLYEVEVPDNDHLLLYDKPLKEQPPAVKKVLEKIRHEMARRDLLEGREDMAGDFWDWDGAYLIKVALPTFVDSVHGATVMGLTGKLLGLSHYDENIAADALAAAAEGRTDKAASLYLRSLGVPGHRYKDNTSRGKEEGTYNYVIYDDTKVKIQGRYRLVDDGPLTDPTIPNAGIWGRTHTAVMGILSKIGGADYDPTETFGDAFKRKLAQKYQPVLRAEERAKEALGVEALPLDMRPSAWLAADERGYKINYLADNYVTPMAEEMAARNVSNEDLGLYLYARHAPFRNRRIAAINKEFNLTDKPGSGMSDKEASDILGQFADDGQLPDLEIVAKYIDEMIKFSQQEMLDGGLMSASDLASWFKPEEFYVPLRGNEELQPEVEFEFYPSHGMRGGGMSVSGKESPRAFGRRSKADLEGIVGNVITQAQIASDRAYRNKIGQTVLNLIKEAGDENFAKIDRVKRVPVWNKAKGIVEYQIQKRVVSDTDKLVTIFVKVDGNDHKITFNALNPSAMRFVRAAKNLDMPTFNRFVQVVNMATRLWSSLQTTYNPEFVVRNAARDIQTALVNVRGIEKEIDRKGLALSINKNLASLKPLIAAGWGVAHKTGEGLGSAKEWNALYAEFEANGGKLNYNEVQPLEDALKSLDKAQARARRSKFSPIEMGRHVLNAIDLSNSAVENMTRLAAYKALRDRGVEAKVAAKVARELTVNFAQHGEWGPVINSFYGFANAALIGNFRLARSIATDPKILVGLVLAGFLQDLFNHWYDDDEWDQYSEDDKDFHWTILMPDWSPVNIHVPMGYGINSIISLGRKTSELMRGKKNKDGTKMSVMDAAGDVFASFASSWSPVQGSSFWNIIAPSLVDPVVNVTQNKNNWGRPIMPSQPTRMEQQKPDSQLAFDNTAKFWKEMAEGMNRLTGGNEVTPGLVDVSPETIKHVSTELGGGALKTATRTLGLAKAVAKGDVSELGTNDVPFVRAFAGRPYGAANTEAEQISAFYDRLSEARLAIGRAKEMKARFGKDSPEYQEYRKDNEPLIEFAETYEKTQKRLDALNAADNAAKRGLIRANGLERRDRGAIFKATKVLVPHRQLKEEEADKIRATVREKKLKLARQFNEKWLEQIVE